MVDSWLAIQRFIARENLVIPEYYITPGQGLRRKLRDSREPFSEKAIEEEIRADDSIGYVVTGGQKSPGSMALDEHSTRFVVRAHLTEKGSGPLQLSFALRLENRPDWQNLILDFYRHLRLIKAESSLGEYGAWQTCHNVESYERFYGSSEERPKIKVDVLGEIRDRIDTSLNPGRGVSSDFGSISVGSEMWFSEAFWGRYQVAKGQALQALASFEPREVDGLTYVKSWNTDFDHPDGEQGEIQKFLWKILYNREARW